jgi:hypothetical protein
LKVFSDAPDSLWFMVILDKYNKQYIWLMALLCICRRVQRINRNAGHQQDDGIA